MATPSSASWTLALIKPDAFAYAHDILKRVYDNGFVLIAQKQVQMSRDLAQRFYEQHLNKAFFPHLLSFITSGPCLTLVLSKADAVDQWRELMGSTDSEAARTYEPTSIRAMYGTDSTRNAVHGSDSWESASREIAFFFPELCRGVSSISKEDARERMHQQLEPTLTEALAAFCKERPSEDRETAINWLANWLIQHNPNKAQLRYDADDLPTEECDSIPSPPSQKGAKAVDERITSQL